MNAYVDVIIMITLNVVIFYDPKFINHEKINLISGSDYLLTYLSLVPPSSNYWTDKFV